MIFSDKGIQSGSSATTTTQVFDTRQISPSCDGFDGDARARSFSFFRGLWLRSGRFPDLSTFVPPELRAVLGVDASLLRGERSEAMHVVKEEVQNKDKRSICSFGASQHSLGD